MPPPDETREETIRRLQQRAGALEARANPEPRDLGSHAAGYGYRLLGLLIGGVFVGLGFGFAIDAIAGTKPWGLIIGVLAGFGVSLWMTIRSAKAMAAEAAQDWGPPQDLGPEDDKEDD
ncbi:AtpZ/AtpI family protein [Phenylobacterium sp. LjRoot225]|uniref:AtpZ/AtpI family protein n=1 Tax=Phenylobacterium sp. LjRoot225 TaxID=3342285 RepID=UPI003ED00F80